MPGDGCPRGEAAHTVLPAIVVAVEIVEIVEIVLVIVGALFRLGSSQTIGLGAVLLVAAAASPLLGAPLRAFGPLGRVTAWTKRHFWGPG